MRWFKPVLRDSLSTMRGGESKRVPGAALEGARAAMLQALGDEGARINPRLKRRLQSHVDPHALWHARSEVMAVLSELHGEAHAVQVVKRLTPVFDGILPKSLLASCRPKH